MSRNDDFDPEWMDFDDYQPNFREDFIAASVTEATGVTENASFPDHIDKKNYKPRTLVDQTLEIIDPTPQIHQLFVQFNNKFFNNVLLPVAIRWAPKMTSCAGVCTFHPRNGECIISLSQPLLKLRPRKDLVETLLHEMIHAYLFLTQNNRDRDGHGPEFCKHMHRINKEAGTNITIYHSFHAEVALYQQHKWLCDGPCRNRPPFYGKVSRAMNRAPGPSDRWYEEHKRTCGGTFVKVAEPEDYKKGSKSKDDAKGSKKKPELNKTLDDWLSPPKAKSNGSSSIGNGKNNVHGIGAGSNSSSSGAKTDRVGSSGLTNLGTSTNNVHGWGTGGPGSSTPPNPRFKASGTADETKTDRVGSSGLTKLGTSTNNVHGWGTGGPGSSSKTTPPNPSNPKFKVAGVLGGGSNAGRSCLLDKFAPPKEKIIDLTTPEPVRPRSDDQGDAEFQECPICHEDYPALTMNEHIDDCLAWQDEMSRAPRGNNIDHVETFNNNDLPTPTRTDSRGSHRAPPETSPPMEVDGDWYTPPKPRRRRVYEQMPVEMDFQQCPICQEDYPASFMNQHLDECLTRQDEASGGNATPQDVDDVKRKPPRPRTDAEEKKNEVLHECPICHDDFSAELVDDHVAKCSASGDDETMVLCDVCSIWVEVKNLEQHVQKCVLGEMSKASGTRPRSSQEDKHQEKAPEDPSKAPPERCLICEELIPSGMSLDQHLEECNQMAGIYDSAGDDSVGGCGICGKLVPLDVMDVHQELCSAKLKRDKKK